MNKKVPREAQKYMVVIDDNNEMSRKRIYRYADNLKDAKVRAGNEPGKVKRLFKISYKFVKELK